MTILGYVIGAFGITVFADLYGRKPAFIISILMLCIGSILVSLAADMVQMYIFRLLTGIGIGAEIAIVGAYIGEISPKSKRGKYTSIIIILGWIGITSSGPISLLLIGHKHALMNIDGWRIIMGIPGVIALISLLFSARMPESPRWLLSKGKFKDTNLVLVSLGIRPLVKEGGGKEEEGMGKTSFNKEKFGLLLRLFKNKQLLFRILFLIAIWFLVLVPIYASLLLVVAYTNHGYSISQSISINVIGSIGFVAGGVVSILLADKIERKHQVAIASSIMGIAFILRGLLINDYIGLVVASFIAFGSNAWLISSLLVYTSENFPTKIRSSSSGIVEGTSRAFATVGPILFILLEPFGFLDTMIVIAAFSLIAAFLIASHGRHTLDRSLEELNKE
jgi:MFS transporter, putative metabolite:H+ symporter